jgi:cell division septation protein DedD
MSYDFSLDRKASVTLGAGSVLLLILMFVAGVLTGITWRSNTETLALRKPAASDQSRAIAGQGDAGSPANKGVPPQTATMSAGMVPAPAALAAAMPQAAAAITPPAQATPAAAPPSAADNVSAPANATAPAPVSKAPLSVQLAVEVGAFLERANAEKLSERLKEEGYTPQISTGGHALKQWNFVSVGPYHDWDEASQIAAILSRDQGAQAVVRPIR